MARVIYTVFQSDASRFRLPLSVLVEVDPLVVLVEDHRLAGDVGELVRDGGGDAGLHLRDAEQ